MKILIGTLGLLISSVALARDFKPIKSCFNLTGREGSILLKYFGPDRYKRTVTASYMMFKCDAAKVTRIISGMDIVPWLPIKEFSTHREAYPQFDSLVSSIERGSDVIIPRGYTAKDYLKEHPASVYSISLNREVTQKFGHGFGGEVYREWLLQNPKNNRALSEIVGNMKAHKDIKDKRSAQIEIKAMSVNTVLMVSMGLDWDDSITSKTPDYIVKFLQKIKASGMTVQFVKRNPVGLMSENAREISPQVDKVLASGKNVIVLGMCKGMPEILQGVSDAMKGRLNANRSQKFISGRGQIKGVIGLSPMMGGLYWADHRDSAGLIYDALEEILGSIPSADTEMYSNYIAALDSITTELTATHYKNLKDSLPSDVPYLGVTGILPNNGILYVKNSMKPFVDINRKMNLASGANDGFLEYPKTYIPTSWGSNVMNIPVHGSHMLVDGGVNELSLLKPENEEAFYYSILKFILTKR